MPTSKPHLLADAYRVGNHVQVVLTVDGARVASAENLNVERKNQTAWLISTTRELATKAGHATARIVYQVHYNDLDHFAVIPSDTTDLDAALENAEWDVEICQQVGDVLALPAYEAEAERIRQLIAQSPVKIWQKLKADSSPIYNAINNGDWAEVARLASALTETVSGGSLYRRVTMQTKFCKRGEVYLSNLALRAIREMRGEVSVR